MSTLEEKAQQHQHPKELYKAELSKLSEQKHPGHEHKMEVKPGKPIYIYIYLFF